MGKGRMDERRLVEKDVMNGMKSCGKAEEERWHEREGQIQKEGIMWSERRKWEDVWVCVVCIV